MNSARFVILLYQGSKVFLYVKQRVITEFTRIITSQSIILNLADFERPRASRKFYFNFSLYEKK